MADTICIECANKVITKIDGKKYICPNIKYNATKVQPFWEDYKSVTVSVSRGNNQRLEEVTYKVKKCKYFKQKQQPKLSNIFNTEVQKRKGLKSCIVYMPLNNEDEQKIQAIVEKRKVTKWANNLKNILKKADFKEQNNKKVPAKHHKDFTSEEIEFIKNNYGIMTQETIAFNLKTSQTTIFNMCRKLDLNKESKAYTDEQEQQIKDYYNGLTQYKTLTEFAKSIGKSAQSISRKAYRMGIREMIK